MKSTPTPRKTEDDKKENKLPAGQERSGYVKPPQLKDPDPVDKAAAESFPASDPPTFTGATITPSERDRIEKERPDPHPSP
jgi:hypothetical protein